ncbi:transposase, partial [Escherichia coli]
MKKRNFSAEFKRESAQLVVDQTYTVADAAKAMDVVRCTGNSGH